MNWITNVVRPKNLIMDPDGFVDEILMGRWLGEDA